MESKNLKVDDLVVFIGKTIDNEIYAVKVGKIKRLCKDGAFVYYHTDNIAAKTNYKDLYKIENAYALDNLGGFNNESRKIIEIYAEENLEQNTVTFNVVKKEETEIADITMKGLLAIISALKDEEDELTVERKK